MNIHLMMATFYQPTKSRFQILMEEPAFPSDTYAIKTRYAIMGSIRRMPCSGAPACR